MAEFARVLQQLGQLIEDETSALRRGEHGRLSEFNYRKGHGFLEFTRAMHSVPAGAFSDPRLAGLILDLRKKLERNKRVLKVHLDAAQEVADVVADAIRESESDGTYSQSIWRTGG